MNFVEAEQRFQFLEDQRVRGVISDEQYRMELNRLRITDAQGQLWMLQERTGTWYVYRNNQWMAAIPPVQVPAPPSPPPPPTRTQPAPAPVPQPIPQPAPEKQGGGCGKVLLYLALWAVFWIVVAALVLIFAEETMALAGVGVAALLSLVLMMFSLASAWSGTIVDVRVERIRVNKGDEDFNRYEDVRFAYVRRSNGKTKKMRAMPEWQVGDSLEKRRGESQIRHRSG